MNGITVKRLNQSIPKMSIGGVLTNTASSAVSGALTAGPLGAIAMGGVSLMSGLLGELNENKQEKERKALELKNITKNENQNQAMRASRFNKDGNNVSKLYMSKGGIVKKVGFKTKPIETSKPTVNNSNMTLLDEIGRYVALTPQVFNKSVNALISPFNQFGIKSGANPFQQRYYDNIKNAFKDAIFVDEKELQNAYSNLPSELAETGLNLVGGKIAGGVASKVGKLVAPKLSKINNPLSKISDKVSDVAKNELSYIKEYIFGPAKTKPRVFIMPETSSVPKMIPQKSSYINEFSSEYPEILGIKMVPKIETIPYRYPTPKLPPINEILNGNKFNINIKPQAIKPKSIDPINNMSKFIKYHSESNLNMPYDDFIKLYNKYPGYRDKVNKAIGMSKGGIVKPIAYGVDKVKAVKPGTDTVKHTLQGQPVMLDNNELVIDDNVVLSADKGHAQKYESLLKAGYPKEYLDSIFIPMAIAGQRSNSKLSLGGSSDNPPVKYWDFGEGIFDLSSMKYLNYGDLYTPGFNQQVNSAVPTKEMHDRVVTQPISKPNTVINPNISFKSEYEILPRTNVNSKLDSELGNNYHTIGRYSTLGQVDKMKPLDITTQINNPNTNVFDNNILASRAITQPPTDMPDYRSNVSKLADNIKSKFTNMTPKNKEILGHVAIAGLQTLGNIFNANKANKIKTPAYNPIQPILQSESANDAIYNNQTGLLQSRINNLSGLLRNTSNSATAAARLGNLAQVEQESLSTINANRIKERNQIANSNVGLVNQAMQYNNQALNQAALLDYQSKVDNVQNRGDIFNSSIDSFKNLIEFSDKSEYDDLMLQAIAKSYGLNYEVGDSIDSLDRKSKGKLKRDLKIYGQ